jgi:hypothetical protein
MQRDGGGGETPEELETLLEDAFLLCDADAVARLFEDGSLLVTGEASRQVRGREAILRAASLLCRRGCGYVADPRRAFQTRDIAPLIGDGVISVARRGLDWYMAIRDPRCSVSEANRLSGTPIPSQFALPPSIWSATLAAQRSVTRAALFATQ